MILNSTLVTDTHIIHYMTKENVKQISKHNTNNLQNAFEQSSPRILRDKTITSCSSTEHRAFDVNVDRFSPIG